MKPEVEDPTKLEIKMIPENQTWPRLKNSNGIVQWVTTGSQLGPNPLNFGPQSRCVKMIQCSPRLKKPCLINEVEKVETCDRDFHKRNLDLQLFQFMVRIRLSGSVDSISYSRYYYDSQCLRTAADRNIHCPCLAFSSLLLRQTE